MTANNIARFAFHLLGAVWFGWETGAHLFYLVRNARRPQPIYTPMPPEEFQRQQRDTEELQRLTREYLRAALDALHKQRGDDDAPWRKG